MSKYCKKPVVVEAFQWTGDGSIKRPEWFNEAYDNGVVVKFYSEDVSFGIKTLEGTMKARVGDYIIKGVNGELYPCKPDIFEKTYELVED